MEASLDTWTVVFLIAAIHGLILAAVIVRNKDRRDITNKLLGTFLLLFSLTLIEYVAYWTNYRYVYPHLINFSGTFTFLFGPILYLYIKSLYKPLNLLELKNIAHFVPFALYLIYLFPFYIQSGPEKIAILSQYSPLQIDGIPVIALMKISHLTVYSILIHIHTHQILPEKYNSNVQREKYSSRSSKTISYCFTGYTLSFTLYYILVASINFNVEYDYMISFSMTIFIFAVGYLGYSAQESIVVSTSSDEKYRHSNLNKEEAATYLNKLYAFMEDEKPFINGDLRLKEVADHLEVPSHHLSQVINDKLGMNFNEFINSYRVKEAKKILSDPDKSNYKVLRVAFESGFNNKTSFNKSFKREEGMTPTEYRKNALNGR